MNSSDCEADNDHYGHCAANVARNNVKWFGGRGSQGDMFRLVDAANMYSAVPDRRDHTSYVARDSGCGSKGAKDYAWFGSHDQLAEFLFEKETGNQPCCLYELIREGRACRLYFDIEFIGENGIDGGMRKLDFFVDTLGEALKTRYKKHLNGEDPQMVVINGSRACAAGFKHSYHVVVCNVVFPNNTGDMKRFVELFVSVHRHKPMLVWHDEKTGEVKSIVDQGVYTKNRCFRTPLSHKLSDETHTKLVRIERRPVISQRSGLMSPHAPKKMWTPAPYESAADVLKSLVTHVSGDARIVSEVRSKKRGSGQLDNEGDPAKRARMRGSGGNGGGSGGGSSRDAKAAEDDGMDEEERNKRAMMVEQMQALLRCKNLTDFTVTGVHRISSGGSTVYKCRNGTSGRRCMVNQSEIHYSNNPFIQENADGVVYYKCLAPSCSRMRSYRIGHLRH